MSTNPFRKHASSLFASRGCDIDQALVYAHEVMGALSNEQDKTPMLTAIMVIINTAANAFDQAQGPSPEKLAILQLIHNEINNWASSNFEAGVEAWIDNNLDIDGKVQDYLNDNLDLDDMIEGWMDNNFQSKVNDAIDNLDLVVQVR